MAKREVLAVVAVLALLLVGIVVLGSVFKLPGLKFLSTFQGEGMTYSSIDCNIPYGTTADKMNQYECIVRASATGGGEFLYGQTQSVTIPEGTKTSGVTPQTTTKPLKIELIAFQETVKYTITAQPGVLYGYGYGIMGDVYDYTDAFGNTMQVRMAIQKNGQPEPQCYAGQLGILAGKKDTALWGDEKWVKACVQKSPWLSLGVLSGIPAYNFKGKFVITTGNTPQELEFDSAKQSQVSTSDRSVIIENLGGLIVSDTAPPDLSLTYTPVYFDDQTGSGWRLALSGTIRNLQAAEQLLDKEYGEFMQKNPPCYIGSLTTVCESATASNLYAGWPIEYMSNRLYNSIDYSYQSTYNPRQWAVYDEIKQKIQAVEQVGATFLLSPATSTDYKQGSFVALDLPRRFTTQEFVLRVKADKLGIVAPVAKPTILSITSSPMAPGQSANVVASVRGGDVATSFEPTITGCSFYLDASPLSYRFGLGVGEVKDKVFGIRGPQSAIQESCNLRVYNSQNPTLFDEKPFSASVTTQPIQCAEGQYSTSLNSVYLCKDAKLNLIETCTNTNFDLTGARPICAIEAVATVAPEIGGTPPPPQEKRGCKKSDTLCQFIDVLMKNLIWVIAATIVVIVSAVLFRMMSPLAPVVLVGGLAVIAAAMFLMWLLSMWFFWILLLLGGGLYIWAKVR